MKIVLLEFMSSFYIMYIMFQSHDLLQQFSQYLGAHILNCTLGSMIDSYDRIKSV